jgi:sulfite reductase (ferredoxin)
LNRYLVARGPDENLRQFFSRHSSEEIRVCLAGGDFVGVERDPAAGRVPHGVEG